MNKNECVMYMIDKALEGNKTLAGSMEGPFLNMNDKA